jgi:hypothetical protein
LLKYPSKSGEYCTFAQILPMKRSVLVLITLAVLLVGSSWGFLVHRTINQLAVYSLPKGLTPFFYSGKEYLVKNATRPDERRNTDSTEANKHFIDFEAFGDSAAWKMPHDWQTAVQRYSKDTLLEYGYVPYQIMVTKGKLTEAFRQKNSDSILYYAADLGHYVADAHVPLHTSINYDGQLTGQKGLHSLWESVIPEIELSHYNLYSKHKAKYLKHPEEDLWRAMQEAHVLVTDVFRQEAEASKQFTDSTKYRTQVRRGREVKSYTTEFAKAYNARLGQTINGQLIKSVGMVADFWYTSWVDAGKPDLSSLVKPLSNEGKDAYKKELKAYKKNELLKNKLLIARASQREGE